MFVIIAAAGIGSRNSSSSWINWALGWLKSQTSAFTWSGIYYGTHKTPGVKRWFQRHPEYQLHFVPTYSSWLNPVERFFAESTEKRIGRRCFGSVKSLEQAIREYLENHNKDPKPFVWTATAETILERVANVCKRIYDSGH